MASENDPTTPDTAADVLTGDVTAAEVSEPAPAEKPKRRRATKKAAAPAAEPDAGAATADADAAPAGPGDEAEAPATKATRKRAAKKTTTKSAAKTPAKRAKKTVEAAEPAADDAPTDDAPAADAPAEVAPAEVAADEVVDESLEVDAAEDAVEETPAAAVPSFGLLFQAPEPVAPRRRRATAPAQAPAERIAEEEPAAAAATDDLDTQPAETDSEVPEGRAGRRSRGGRGGRTRAERAPSSDTGDAGTVDATADEAGEQDGDRPSDDRATDEGEGGSRSRRRRGGRGRRGRSSADDEQGGAAAEGSGDNAGEAGGTGPDDQGDEGGEGGESGTSRRRRRRRRGAGSGDGESDDPPGTVTRVREPRSQRDEPTAVKGSTRLEAKKQRRREGREAGRRRTIITEAEFLARRESVERVMVVRGRGDRTQIGVLEDGVLVEHYVSRETTASMAGNVYLGRVQNVLPSMEAAFVDIGKGRNAVLYAGEVNWDAAGLEGGQARRIENALSSGDTVLTQVTKDPIGHKGARLTSQISLPGRYLVYVPEGQMTGISRKLPDTERARLKAILKEVVPDHAGVIVRTAAEGASEEELRADVERLTKIWDKIKARAESAGAKKAGSGGAPALLHGEPDLTVRVIRDVFTEDFTSLVISGDKAWNEVSQYVEDVAPDLAPRLQRWTAEEDVFAAHRIDESLAKAMDRKVWLPSGGSLVIDRTEAMTVVDVNTGKFVGSGGNLEETVTKNNLEAAEEIVRQLRLRDIGGIIVIDFIDMVLESNRDLVVRRLLECLGRDRTKHQVAEVTSLGLVQMTRKRVGSGLIEVFSEQCEHCGGRGIVVHTEVVDRSGGNSGDRSGDGGGARSGRGRRGTGTAQAGGNGPGGASGSGASGEESQKPSGPTAAQIAAAAHAAALRRTEAGEHAVEASGGAVPADELAAVAETTFGGPLDAESPQPAPADELAAVAETTFGGPLDAESAQPAQAAAQDVETPAEPAQALAEPGHDARTTPEPAAAPETTPDAVPPVAGPAAGTRRGRRKRGRVVAPAGPPRGSASEETAAAGSTGAEPAEVTAP